MAPYWLISGMTPAQGAATGSFMAIGMGASSLGVLRTTGNYPRDKSLTIWLSITAVAASIFGAFILPKVDVTPFASILALITIAAIPLLFIRLPPVCRFTHHRNIGLGLLTALLIVSSIIMSSAFSILLALVLINFFNLPTLQTTALRRLVTLNQAVVLFVILAAQGFFVWQHALAGIIGGSVGSYLGTKFAVSKGETFAKWALAVSGFVSAFILIT